MAQGENNCETSAFVASESRHLNRSTRAKQRRSERLTRACHLPYPIKLGEQAPSATRHKSRAGG